MTIRTDLARRCGLIISSLCQRDLALARGVLGTLRREPLGFMGRFSRAGAQNINNLLDPEPSLSRPFILALKRVIGAYLDAGRSLLALQSPEATTAWRVLQEAHVAKLKAKAQARRDKQQARNNDRRMGDANQMRITKFFSYCPAWLGMGTHHLDGNRQFGD